MIDLEKYKSITIKEYYTERTKPLCVLGVLLTVKGISIRNEMLEWLTPVYDVIAGNSYNPPGGICCTAITS